LVWLNTVPDKKDESRLDTFQREEKVIYLPEVTAMYLINYLFEVGPCSQDGMGMAPISWQELESWQRQTGIELQQWELLALKIASKEYVSQTNISHKADCPPPGKILEQEPHKVASHIKNVLRG
jgi:hypothetical protein